MTTDPKTRKSKTALWFLEEKTRVFSAMDSVYASVANLTQWADRLIVEGKVDPTEDYVGKVIDPVKKSVACLAGLVTDLDATRPAEVCRTASNMHNSLPDIAAAASVGDEDEASMDQAGGGDNDDQQRLQLRKPPASANPTSDTAFFPPKFRSVVF